MLLTERGQKLFDAGATIYPSSITFRDVNNNIEHNVACTVVSSRIFANAVELKDLKRVPRFKEFFLNCFDTKLGEEFVYAQIREPVVNRLFARFNFFEPTLLKIKTDVINDPLEIEYEKKLYKEIGSGWH